MYDHDNYLSTTQFRYQLVFFIHTYGYIWPVIHGRHAAVVCFDGGMILQKQRLHYMATVNQVKGIEIPISLQLELPVNINEALS